MINHSRKLQNRITAGRWTLPAAILISATCQVASYFLLPESKEAYSWANRLLSLLLCGATGYFLIVLNNAFALIRMRASVQTAIFFLLVTVCPVLHQLHAGNMAAAALLASFFFLFRSYQQLQPSGLVFHTFVCLAVGSLFFPPMLYLVPVYWMGSYMFQSLTLRSFFASLVGLLLPYWLLCGYLAWQGEWSLFAAWGTRCLPVDRSVMDLNAWEVATLGYLALLFVVSAAHCLLASLDDKLRTRAYLQFLILLDVVLFMGVLCFPAYCACWIAMLLIGVSILAGHLFVLTHSKASNLFFLGVLIGWVLLLFYNICQQ